MNKKFKNNTNVPVTKRDVNPNERKEEIYLQSDENSTFLPKSINIDDIELSFFEKFIDDGDFVLNIDGNKVPAFFMTNERWGDFEKTWMLTDQDKNVVPPFITVKRVTTKKGTYYGDRYSIPNKKLFHYTKVPTYNNGVYGYDLYKIPQPTPIDLTYEISMFTRYMVDVNFFQEVMLHNYASRQYYITVNGHYIRTEREEDFNNEDTVESIDENRYYVNKATIKVFAYLQDEKDFKVIESYNRLSGKIKTQDSNDNDSLQKFR